MCFVDFIVWNMELILVQWEVFVVMLLLVVRYMNLQGLCDYVCEILIVVVKDIVML